VTGDDVVAASLDIAGCIEKELDLHRLHSISGWMWTVGWLAPPRPLHYQLLLSRDIFLTEQIDMHLVWTRGRLFLKPIPRFLLEPRVWVLYLASPEPCNCFRDDAHMKGDTEDAKRDIKCVRKCNGGLRTSALGFLFSYAALITYESDFKIAQEKHLLPKEVKWTAWISLVKQLDTKNIYGKIDDRFKYGELRLSRLNKIYWCHLQLHGYMKHWDQYGSFLRDNFTWLAASTVYVAIVLTAMQVGLAIDRLSGNESFVSASYGFTILSILGPIVTAGLMIVVVLSLFIINWRATSIFWNERSRFVQLRKPVTKKTRKNSTDVSV
jgi:hypothetical protein